MQLTATGEVCVVTMDEMQLTGDTSPQCLQVPFIAATVHWYTGTLAANFVFGMRHFALRHEIQIQNSNLREHVTIIMEQNLCILLIPASTSACSIT